MVDKIKTICQELDITQMQLADMLGLHYSSFSKWKEKIPKNSEITLDLLVENHRLKQELTTIKEALKVLRQIV